MRFLAGLRLFVVLFAAAAAATTAEAAAPQKPFNVLLLMADDWRTELGCYGVPGMITPNLDKLAASGVRFDRAYCQFSVCNASRASMLTGRYPNQTKVVFNGTPLRQVHPDWITLPQYFRQHGYAAAIAGKIFHGRFPDEASWDETLPEEIPKEFRAKRKAIGVGGVEIEEPRATGEDRARDGEGGGPPGVKCYVLDGDGESDRDYHIASDGIKLLEKYGADAGDKPFFIGVGFHRPHATPTAPKRFYDMYDIDAMPLAPDFALRPTVPAGAPSVALPDENDTYMLDDTSEQTAREVLRAYRASATWTDWNMGRVLDALDRLGLADNTIVVMCGDHGYHNGEKGRWGKNTSFEIAMRVPLLVRMPGAAGNGGVSPRTVQLMDIYPTLAQECGLPPAEGQQGHSLAPLLDDPRAAWSWPACGMSKSGGAPISYSIHTEKWHYVEWDHGKIGAMLFDPANDPYEMHNLAADPQHATTVTELKAELAKTMGDMPVRIETPPREIK